MEGLVQWLHAQLDEDERIARDATPGRWWHNPGKQWLGPDAFEKYDLRQGEEFVGYGGPHPFTGAVCSTGPASNMQGMKDAAFIAEHDPVRVLREIDVWRALLRRANGGVDHPHTHPGEVDADHLRRHHDDGLLRLLASVYADRPGYLESWRP